MTPGTAAVWGVDVGGTTTKALLLAPDGTVLDERRAPTPSPDADGTRVASAVTELVGPDPGGAVGVVVPGVVDESRGVAVWSANLGFRDAPLLRLLSGRIGAPVAFGQDVRAGALGETVDGAAADAPGPVVFLPVGTGVAAAVLLDGVPLVSGGWAGEVGQLVLTGGRRAGEVVEAVGSASALARRAGEPDARRVAERVAAGDPVALELWQDAVDALAVAVAALVVSVAPALVVVGGGLAQAGSTLLDPLIGAVAALTPGLRQPRVVPAVHGDLAAARGAAVLARRLAGGPRPGTADPVRAAP
ncbi:ROK family protein [Phycicoccus sp. CSK15P-2]|uniref:ROK family protein n=1 Tax=Phycicoccus sp. CSK15P-2 TaxID=2807627 RepID=UPI00194EEB01|nr:ROK family protein [Phycicoccus sp. CSK15P-2]MBM6405863.1 ROK family protein [Phycicoccus sp. CSK15P-2]